MNRNKITLLLYFGFILIFITTINGQAIVAVEKNDPSNNSEYYCFHKDEINGMINTPVYFKYSVTNKIELNSYGQKQNDTTITKNENPKIIEQKEPDKKIIYSSGTFFSDTIKFAINLLKILLAIFLILAIIHLFKKINKGRKTHRNFVLFKRASKISSIPLEKIMTKDVITIPEDKTAIEALNKMINEEINSIVVVKEDKLTGILTESDFLSRAYGNENIKNLKVMAIMTPAVISLKKNAEITDAIKVMVQHKIRKIPIVENGKIIGIVTITDILNVLKDFFMKNYIESPSLPIVNSIYKKNIAKVSKDAKLNEIYSEMLRMDSSCAIVYEIKSNDNVTSKRAIGIITNKDLLDEYYKNPAGFEKIVASSLMTSPITSISPSSNVLEVLSPMLEKNIRRLPVMEGNEIVGILTQDALLDSLSYLIEYSTGLITDSDQKLTEK